MAEEIYISKYDGETTDGLLDVVNEHKESIGSPIPVLTVMRTVEGAGNIFGDGWMPCDGSAIDTNRYPGIALKPAEVTLLNNEVRNPQTENVRSIVRNGNLIAGLSLNDSDVMLSIVYSVDGGLSFHKAPITLDESFESVLFYVHDRFFVFNHDVVYYSTDGANWMIGSALGGSLPWNINVGYASGNYLVTDKDSGSNFYSPDGKSWYSSNDIGDCNYMVSDGRVAITGVENYSGPYYNDGSDGDWHDVTGIALNEPINYKAAYVCGHFLIFSHGNSSNSGFYTSEDGKNFVKIDSGFAINHLHSYTFINNSSVILISDDTDHVLYRSTDGGVTFTEYSSGQFPNRVINEVFVYIENTDLYQSADGVEWVHVDISPYTVNESTLSGDVYTTSANQLYRINVGMILPYEKDCYVKLR